MDNTKEDNRLDDQPPERASAKKDVRFEQDAGERGESTIAGDGEGRLNEPTIGAAQDSADQRESLKKPISQAPGGETQGKPENDSGDAESVTSDYQMTSDIFQYDELRYQENFCIKKYKNAAYKGQVNLESRKREGFGVLLSDGNRIYEGQWLADKRNGQGYETYKNGGSYRGGFKANKPHGKGIYTWANGEVYDGEWVHSCKTGFGVWRGLAADTYMGEWRDNKVWGFGVHQWQNGDKYEGEWARSLKNGQGTDFFANQDKYNGEYKDGKPDGYGQYKWKSGAIYVGEFKQGMKHGKGKWKRDEKAEKSNQYTGAYVHD